MHIAVDILGLPHAIGVTTANVNDRAGALEIFEAYAPGLKKVKKALLDGGYTGDEFAESVRALIGAEVEIAKRSDIKKGEVTPKRWVVERSFAWLEKCRRLWKNCERKTRHYLQMAVLAFIRILLNRK